MFTVYDVLHKSKQKKKRRQTLESAQYGLEIICKEIAPCSPKRQYKNQKECQSFFPPLIFVSLLFSLFFIAWSDFKVFGSREFKVHTGDLV